MTVQAWLVIDDKGNKSVWLDKSKADEYAARKHGIVKPLVFPPGHDH